jgi:hypothetical protein
LSHHQHVFLFLFIFLVASIIEPLPFPSFQLRIPSILVSLPDPRLHLFLPPRQKDTLLFSEATKRRSDQDGLVEGSVAERDGFSEDRRLEGRDESVDLEGFGRVRVEESIEVESG